MRALAVLLLALAPASPAPAKTIDIAISHVARLADGNLVVDLKLGNSGDERALSVTPILHFGDKQVRGKGRPTLDPTRSFDETLSLPVGTLGEGRWPYRLAVGYTDVNQYPLQTLQVQTVVVGSPPPPKVVVPTIQGSEIVGAGTLAITVKNLTPESRTTRVNVFVPAGIEATGGSREVPLDAWEDAILEVPIINRSALVGSRYPIFVTAEYDDGPVHQAAVAQGSLAILGIGSFIGRWGRWLSIAGIALVVAWVGYLGTRMLPRRPEIARSR